MRRRASQLIASLLVLAGGCRSILGIEDPLVGDAGSADGPTADARMCFGEPPFEICLTTLPTGPVAVGGDAKIDTAVDCPLVYPAGPDGQTWCVIVGTSISVSGQLDASGARPLVLLATGALSVSGEIDAASHRASSGLLSKRGPAAGTGCAAPTMVDGGVGRAGGSFGTKGGDGGDGDNKQGELALPATVIAAVTLRGGCPGGGTEPVGASSGGRTEGGGAIYLLGGDEVRVDGTVNASGAGGNPGAVKRGGAGGGSGGLIVIWSPAILVGGGVFANGGGGGAGGGSTSGSLGAAGMEPVTSTTPAPGGAAIVGSDAGGGGNGAATAASGVMAAGSGQDGVGADGGGGGGGGGLGWIRLMGDAEPDGGGTFSPPPTP